MKFSPLFPLTMHRQPLPLAELRTLVHVMGALLNLILYVCFEGLRKEGESRREEC